MMNLDGRIEHAMSMIAEAWPYQGRWSGPGQSQMSCVLTALEEILQIQMALLHPSQKMHYIVKETTDGAMDSR